MFSKSTIYAIKIMVYLATQLDNSKSYIGVKEISEAIDSPKAFTAKILQQLSKGDLLKSLRGPNGGFCLYEDKTVSIAEIVRVIEGSDLLDGCILGFEDCSEKRPCPVHFKLMKMRKYLSTSLMTTDIDEMRRIIEKGEGFLKY